MVSRKAELGEQRSIRRFGLRSRYAAARIYPDNHAQMNVGFMRCDLIGLHLQRMAPSRRSLRHVLTKRTAHCCRSRKLPTRHRSFPEADIDPLAQHFDVLDGDIADFSDLRCTYTNVRFGEPFNKRWLLGGR
jgi:hypothetical protein